jgi:hypothetical protein
MHDNAGSLIPELARWNDGNGIDLAAWGFAIGRFDHAIAYLQAFWPDFVEYDDCIFRYKPSPTTYSDWMQSLDGDRQRVESVMNHFHILDMFNSQEFEPNEHVARHLAAILKDMWSCKLMRDFPERHFSVEVYDSETDDLLGYEITFYQDRD